MSDKRFDDGSAFPRSMSVVNGVLLHGQDGMSLRDYFAAKAMQVVSDREKNITGISYGFLCKRAYEVADEMLKARDAK
jgi:hypothetical protein